MTSGPEAVLAQVQKEVARQSSPLVAIDRSIEILARNRMLNLQSVDTLLTINRGQRNEFIQQQRSESRFWWLAAQVAKAWYWLQN